MWYVQLCLLYQMFLRCYEKLSISFLHIKRVQIVTTKFILFCFGVQMVCLSLGVSLPSVHVDQNLESFFYEKDAFAIIPRN